MSELILDSKGIWVDKDVIEVSYPESGNANSYLLEENSFWFNHRNEILKIIINRFPFKGNFADIGGGNGFQAKFIANNFNDKKIFLIEPGYIGCLNGKKRGLQNIFNVEFQKFNFIEKEVKAVGLFDVLEHIEDDVSFIKQLKLKLPPESYIYISVPAHMYLWSDVDIFGGHFRRYNKKMIVDLTQKSQTELIYCSYFFIYIPLITYLLRRIPYKLRGRRNDATILIEESENHNPSKFIIYLFKFFHQFEIRKLKRNKLFHGASCVIVLKT